MVQGITRFNTWIFLVSSLHDVKLIHSSAMMTVEQIFAILPNHKSSKSSWRKLVSTIYGLDSKSEVSAPLKKKIVN